MNSIINLIALILVAFVAALFFGWLGFRISAPVSKPERRPITRPDPIPLPKSLPDPLYHYFEKNFGTLIYPPASVVAWGRGQIIARRLPSLGPLWVPISWSIDLIPGESFVLQDRITWFRQTFIRGGEEFREEKGQYMVGGKTVQSPHIDHSEQTILWLYTLLLAPTTLLLDPWVTWQAGEDNTVCIQVPFSADENRNFTLHFDTESWAIERITTERTASRDGRLVPFRFILQAPRNFESDLVLPSQVSAAWDDDVYFRYEIKGVLYNVDAGEVMEKGVS